MSGALPKFQSNFYSKPQYVSSNKRIVNKNIAANGIAYSSPSKIMHYLNQAKAGMAVISCNSATTRPTS
jgi:hypothetical protein